ncbi:MAG: hypothetical protein JW780_06100, partial [Clostridiales bacterium]|nr:hypothetical protein [Clostridiales bacterium]
YTFGEAFLYWTQYFFAYSPDLDDNEKSQANIKAKMRYERFVQALITRFQKARAGKEEILTEKIWNEEETA